MEKVSKTNDNKMIEVKEAETLVGIKELFVSMGVNSTEVTLDAHLLKDLGLDSLDLADLMMRVEDTYNVKIDAEDAEGMVCVADVVNYIEMKLNKW